MDVMPAVLCPTGAGIFDGSDVAWPYHLARDAIGTGIFVRWIFATRGSFRTIDGVRFCAFIGTAVFACRYCAWGCGTFSWFDFNGYGCGLDCNRVFGWDF